MSESDEYPTEDPKRTSTTTGSQSADVPGRFQPLAAPLNWDDQPGQQTDVTAAAPRSGASSGMRARVQGGLATPTRSPRSGRLQEAAAWDEPGVRTPSNVTTPRVHVRTGSSVSANFVEMEPDPEMALYAEKQAEHSARMAMELSQQDVVCLEDEEDTRRVMLSSAEVTDRRKLVRRFRKELAALQGTEYCSLNASGRLSRPPTPPPEPLPVTLMGAAADTSVNPASLQPPTTTTAATDADADADAMPLHREATMEPDAARRQQLSRDCAYGATDSRVDTVIEVAAAAAASLPPPQPHSGTRSSVPVRDGSQNGLDLDGHNALGRASQSPPPAVVTAAENTREAFTRELVRTSRFFWPLNVAPVYIPHGADGHCPPCDARALLGEEDDEDWIFPYVDTHYYCYSLDAEMAALREMRIEDAVEMDKAQELRDDASSLASGTPAAPARPVLLSDRERKWRYHRHYQIARLQRLWATTVMRQYLLFSLSSLLLIALFVQNTMQGCMNVFDASVDQGWGSTSGLFYSSNNRFGRTVLLTATCVGSGAVTLWVLAAQHMCCGTPSGVEDAEGELVAKRRHGREDTLSEDAAAPSDSASNTSEADADAPHGIHPAVLLIMGVAACTAGSVSIYGGARYTAISLAVFGEAIYGVGLVVALTGLLALMLAEVGLQAALPVQLNVIGTSWLLASAAAFLIIPLLNRYWLTTAAVLQCSIISTVCALLFAVCIVLLVPRDVVERARRPYRRLGSPRSVMRALTNTSFSFVLRVLTFSCVTALVTLLATSATALLVTVPTDLSSRYNDPSGSSSAAMFGSFFPGPELQPDDVRRWLAFMFLVAAFLWVLLLIPRVGAVCARTWVIAVVVFAMVIVWCCYGFLTPALPSDHLGVVRSDDGQDVPRPSTSSAPSSGKSSRHNRTPKFVLLTEWWLLNQCFHPRVCLFLTGASFALLGTSLVRAISNAGVTLPTVPLCYHEGNRQHRHQHRRRHHQRQQQQQRQPSVPVTSPVSEATGLLSGRERSTPRPTSPQPSLASPEPLPLSAAVEGLDTSTTLIHYQRCGGPTAMLVLTALLGLIGLVVTAVALGVETWWLSYRSEHPVDPSRMGATSIPVDAHNVVHHCVATIVLVTAACEVVEVVYAYVRARQLRKEHMRMHHQNNNNNGAV